MSDTKISEAWPDYLMIRDTQLHDDAGGLGQRIFTTAGAGYEKFKYIRADLAHLHPQPAELNEVSGNSGELPPLPPVDGYDKRVQGHYSAKQMRDYARNAIRSAKQERACSGLGIDKMAKELLERHTVAVPVAVEDGRCFMVREQDALDAIRAALAATGKQQVGEVRGDGLPAKDATTSNTAQGLYRKFEVSRTDGSDKPGGKHHGCEYFVLDMTHDPHAKAAASAYAESAQATHPQLAAGMRERYALAARQPVHVQGSDELRTRTDGERAAYLEGIEEGKAQVARQEGGAAEQLDRALGETIDQRDRYHEVADDLASHIERITGVEIGEHSSDNCPWQNAMEAAECYSPAQGIDLGPLRRLYQAYVRLLESGRDRILDFGGTCDPVDLMERTDVNLIEPRNLLRQRHAAPGVE